jgi:SpoIID/LytB domain protein
VPDRAVITIDGRGYGHGHGLSQYGAEGAARKGLSAQQIVQFYYPHTRAGKLGGRVRVWISADTDHNTTVVARPGLQVRDLDSGTTRTLPTSGPAKGATRWRLSSGGGGSTEVSYLTDAWHAWRTVPGDGELRSTGPALTLVVGGHRVTYRGTLQSLGPVPDHPDRITVNVVSLEAYVRGVVPSEMPALWHQAAFRAQAIAARTYAAYEARHPTHPRWNLCDTTACQVYGGRSAEQPASSKAVARTAKQVRLFHGQPAFTQFSASNGGWTADGGQPYLVAKQDPYDGWAGNLVHTWTTSVTSRSIEKAWPAVGNLKAIDVTRRDGNGQWGGRVVKLTLHGSSGAVAVTGDTFRGALGLRSTWFSFAKASAGRGVTPTGVVATTGVDLVALGDSYSAGPLIPAQRGDPASCLRSTNNYPAFLAGYRGVATYRDVTCSGARVHDFAHRQTPVLGGTTVKPQLTALSGGTDLVTVGIGGNDFGLFGSLTSTCPQLAPQDPTGAPCKRHFTNAQGVNTKYRDARRIQQHIATGLRQIHHAAPNAEILVVGYPRLLPQKGTCPAIPFAKGDYAFARHVGYLLNRSIRRAAARHHATYVDTYPASRGHDACAGTRAWINGPQNDPTRAAAYHPFEAGERGIARRVYHVLTGKVAPKGGDAMPPLGSIILNTP